MAKRWRWWLVGLGIVAAACGEPGSAGGPGPGFPWDASADVETTDGVGSDATDPGEDATDPGEDATGDADAPDADGDLPPDAAPDTTERSDGWVDTSPAEDASTVDVDPDTAALPPDAGPELPPSDLCKDGQKGGDETDVDCGGPCGPCSTGKVCAVHADCLSATCIFGLCEKPTCDDEVRNQGESDVDCGGPKCTACALGSGCELSTDCLSSRCDDGTCASCDDGLTTGGETDVDCGGTCGTFTCLAGQKCLTDADCLSIICDAGVCASCSDGVQNGGESDLDCGGPHCAKCPLGGTCDASSDCGSGGGCVDGLCCLVNLCGTCGPLTETCNGVDDDCDGQTDEGAVGAPACDQQLGVCKGTTATCQGAAGWVCHYAGKLSYEATEATCDGKDNDCDGQTDEALTKACLLTKGVCADTVAQCLGAAGWLCDYEAASDGQYATGPETLCDDVDNNCDGAIDDAAGCGSCEVTLTTVDIQVGWPTDQMAVFHGGQMVYAYPKTVNGVTETYVRTAASAGAKVPALSDARIIAGAERLVSWIVPGGGGSPTAKLARVKADGTLEEVASNTASSIFTYCQRAASLGERTAWVWNGSPTLQTKTSAAGAWSAFVYPAMSQSNLCSADVGIRSDGSVVFAIATSNGMRTWMTGFTGLAQLSWSLSTIDPKVVIGAGDEPWVLWHTSSGNLGVARVATDGTAAWSDGYGAPAGASAIARHPKGGVVVAHVRADQPGVIAVDHLQGSSRTTLGWHSVVPGKTILALNVGVLDNDKVVAALLVEEADKSRALVEATWCPRAEGLPCKTCPGTCGDGACNLDEGCETCAADCGECVQGGDCCGDVTCSNADVRACVCPYDPYCCSGWDDLCAEKVTKYECGVCP